MIPRQPGELPQTRPKRATQLRIVELRAVHSITTTAKSVLGGRGEQRLELGLALEQASHECEGAQRGARWPMLCGAGQAFGERGGAPGRCAGALGEEREVEGAEEHVGNARRGWRRRGGVGGRGCGRRRRRRLDVRHERQCGEQRVKAVAEVAQVDIEGFP
jgi:hypothetical protein